MTLSPAHLISNINYMYLHICRNKLRIFFEVLTFRGHVHVHGYGYEH
jgi:hypothetical protein